MTPKPLIMPLRPRTTVDCDDRGSVVITQESTDPCVDTPSAVVIPICDIRHIVRALREIERALKADQKGGA